MKKLILSIFVIPLLFSCNQKELKQLKETNKQLIETNRQRDSSLNDFIDTFNTIEDNLDQIKDKEQIISIDVNENPSKNRKDKITKDINLINNLLDKNKKEIEKLNKKLKYSWFKNSKLKKLTESLQNKIIEKELEISVLNNKLSDLNIKVENLNDEVDDLTNTVSALDTENNKQEKIINDKIEKLNTAYYVVGTVKELKEKNIISRNGGVLGIGKTSALSNDLKVSNFNIIDISKTTLIPVSGKKMELVSNHPKSSYKIETKGEEKLIVILNATDFWRSSKYLVVSVR